VLKLSVAAGLVAIAGALAAPAPASSAAPKISIKGNHFVDGSGATLRLIGINVAGAEFTCVEPVYNDFRKSGVWDGPVDAAAIAAMASWKINAVRVPLNEDCWLGINPVRRTEDRIARVRGRTAKAFGAKVARHYRSEVKAFVRRLHAAGLVAILDLHWTAPGSVLAAQQYPLPDTDHSAAFWRSVATTFKGDHSTVFELFNEPMLANADGADTLRWPCMRDGCTLPNRCADCGAAAKGTFRTPGFTRLIATVRATGARNPVLVPGRYYSNDLSSWLTYRPRDKLKQVGATFHAYEGLPCADTDCWDREVAAVAAQVPVTSTEFGPSVQDRTEPCDASHDQRWMDWADGHGVGYLAWWWNDENFDTPKPKCALSLIDDFGGTPRDGHGVAVHDHLAALSEAQGGGPVR
jgi:endoglucanase